MIKIDIFRRKTARKGEQSFDRRRQEKRRICLLFNELIIKTAARSQVFDFLGNEKKKFSKKSLAYDFRAHAYFFAGIFATEILGRKPDSKGGK